VVAGEASDQAAVLLLNVGVVVLVIGPPPGEGDVVGPAVTDEVGVEELRAVVGVDPGKREGEPLTNLVQRQKDPALAFAQ